MPGIKLYACKYEKVPVWTTRKEARKCIMLHMKPTHIKGEKREGKSNITEAMLVREAQ